MAAHLITLLVLPPIAKGPALCLPYLEYGHAFCSAAAAATAVLDNARFKGQGRSIPCRPAD